MAPETKTTVPQLLLEKLALGELAPEDAARVKRRLEFEDGGLARLDELRRSNEEILLTHPPRAIAPEIRRRAGTKLAKRAGFLLLAPVLAAAGAALMLGRAPPEDVHLSALGVETAGDLRTKGDTPVLRIYRHTNGGNERLQPGASVRPGDLLQVAYVAMGSGYGVVFSVDGRGSVTLHHPRQAGQPQALLKAGEVLLPQAYELDDAPSFERFFIVGSQDAPVDLDAVLAGARQMAQDPDRAQGAFLTLPDGLEQYSITLRKAE